VILIVNNQIPQITLVPGPCAIETEKLTHESAYKVSLVKDAVEPFHIKVGYRGGAWKPRTRYWNGNGEREFDGTREDGLQWLADAVNKYGLFAVTECMSEEDLRHFGRFLEDGRDYVQVGSRNSQNFALEYQIGGTRFGVLLKNPQHGVNVDEAVGAIQRFVRNREVVYCVRGQQKYIDPDGLEDEHYQQFMASLLSRPTQDPDSRNLNNIGAIHKLRNHPRFALDNPNRVQVAYDPSHTWGGRNDKIRRKLGQSAIDAVRIYGYDWVELDIHDHSHIARVDGDQALLTTTNGIRWIETNAGQGPGVKRNGGKEPTIMPLTLVDISENFVEYQAERMGLTKDDPQVILAKQKLRAISWDMTPVSVR